MNANHPPFVAPGYDMREYLQPRRVTNAMWDYSWLQGHYPGGAYEDWDKALEELMERKFNTVRIDAFPHIIGRDDAPGFRRMVPAEPLINWGFSTVDHEHDYAAELVEFVGKCKQRGIWVILSTWSAGKIAVPEEATGEDIFHPLWEAWKRTLDLLDRHGLLDCVLYVDFDQEFPYFSNLQSHLAALGDENPPTMSGNAAEAMEAAGRREAGVNKMAWNEAQMRLVSEYFATTCQYFQKQYPGLRFTFSLTSFWKEVRAMGLRVFDVLELHTWIHSPRFDARTGFPSLLKDRDTRDYKDYMRRLRETHRSMRPMLMQAMLNQMNEAREWSLEIAAPLITTEAWGPWWHMDHPDLEWDWLYDWCEECIAAAPAYGFWGITPWNYSHPYWHNWINLDWYQRVNGRFLKS